MFLYKIMSQQDWQESQKLGYLKPLAADAQFIHLSTDQQLDRIIAKYWSGHDDVVVIKLDPTKFTGNLVLEANPGGSAKYYHLYGGIIPFDAVVEHNVQMEK